jgi:hypothetical protein
MNAGGAGDAQGGVPAAAGRGAARDLCSTVYEQCLVIYILASPQAAPVTLKAAFLQPLGGALPTALATDLFGRTDADFMALFVGGCCLQCRMSKTSRP